MPVGGKSALSGKMRLSVEMTFSFIILQHVADAIIANGTTVYFEAAFLTKRMTATATAAHGFSVVMTITFH